MPAAPSAELKTVEEPSQWPLRERRLVLGLLAALVVIKLCYVFTLAVNSDEPQHLHVAWGWTQGQVQYRDFFDNHTPLFHLLSAPLVAVIDERANILVWMRLAMLPLYAVSLGCVFWLGARLYSRRVGMWAAFLGGTCPVFLALSTQYRADILWMTVWFVTFAVALTGRFTTRRAFAVGLLLGITFCVSLKTSLLLVSLLGAVGAALCFLPPQERRRMLAQSAGKVFLALCGLCAVPLALLGYFKWQHALQALSYCVVSHNTLPRIQSHLSLVLHWVAFVTLLPLVALVGRSILRSGAEQMLAVRRALVFLTPAFFLLLLFCFWPHVTGQDFLPVAPLLALAITPLLLSLGGRLGKPEVFLPLLLVGAQLAFGFSTHKLSSKGDRLIRPLVADVLRLTRPGDYVMDAKGESIFRQRPFYYVLETMTNARLSMAPTEKGAIPNTIAADMVAKRTCVVLASRRLPAQTLEWVQHHYLPVTGGLYVTGCYLSPAPASSGDSVTRSFEVAIEASYVVESSDGPVQGTLDGVPLSGAVTLSPGTHTFACKDNRMLVVYWAQAAERKFTPLYYPLTASKK